MLRDRAADRQELAAMLTAAAAGRFAPPDGRVTILRQPAERDAGVISFSGYAVVFACAVAGSAPGSPRRPGI